MHNNIGAEPSVAMAYQVACSQEDSFMIRSEDEHEVIQHVKEHAEEKHDLMLSDNEARDMIEQTS
jgi:predicted small metal-binding protein